MDLTYEIRLITVEALKLKLGSGKNEAPNLVTRAAIRIAGSFFMTITREVTAEDLVSLSRAKALAETLGM
jgi:hypothetical protein